MKLIDSMTVENTKEFPDRAWVRLSMARMAPLNEIEKQKTELCRDVMHELGLTEKEMIELEQRSKNAV